MGTNPYVQPTLTGYNASPPPDDGTTGADNKLNWSKHKEKLGDPLKTFSEAIDSAVNTAFEALVITNDVAAETAIVGFDRFSNIRAVQELAWGQIKQRIRTLESTAFARTDQSNTFTEDQVITPSGSAGDLTLGRTDTHGDAADVAVQAFVGKDSASNTETYVDVTINAVLDNDGAEDATYVIRSVRGGSLAQRLALADGLQVGSPTGGDQGTGIVNAVDYYENAVAVRESNSMIVAMDFWS